MMPDGFRLWVTGKDTAARELAAICQSGRDVSYRGLLPLPELDDLYSRCAIAVNPTRSGSGVQMKLMDALSRGVPVVTSSSSNPFEKFLSAATSPEEWVRAIVSGSQSPVRFDYKSYLQDASDRWIRWLDARNWDERS